jgi:hypothetical protein
MFDHSRSHLFSLLDYGFIFSSQSEAFYHNCDLYTVYVMHHHHNVPNVLGRHFCDLKFDFPLDILRSVIAATVGRKLYTILRFRDLVSSILYLLGCTEQAILQRRHPIEIRQKFQYVRIDDFE